MLPFPVGASLPSFAQRLPFFYGWLIVGLAMMTGFLASGVNNVSMSVVFKPLSEDLGWSRSMTAGAIAIGTLAGSVLAPFTGRLADHIGCRILLPVGGILVGGLVLVLSQVSEPWQLYAAYVPTRALAQALLFGAVPLTAVANWFFWKRPRAFGLVVMAVPLGSSVMALVYQVLISNFGWRSAFLFLGPLLLTLVVLPAAVLLRRRPEDLGLLPDGTATQPEAGARETARRQRRRAAEEKTWTLHAALRTRFLVPVVIAESLSVIAGGAVSFHLVAFLTDGDLDPLVATGALSVFAFSGAMASGVWGYLAERVAPAHLFVACLLVAAGAMALLLQQPTPLLAYAFAFIFGLTARGEDTLVQIMVADYFGRRSFGTISGFTNAITRAGLGLGPFLAATMFDLTGGYGAVFTIFAVTFVLAAGLIVIVRPWKE